MDGHSANVSDLALSRATSSNLDAFAAVIERLEVALDAETNALRQNLPYDLADACQRKRQGLLELSRIMPRLNEHGEHERARDRLGPLAVKLERNRVVLDVQLRAVGEVAAIIAHTMKAAESDGTYSMIPGRL
jgi:hypothetical protein